MKSFVVYVVLLLVPFSAMRMVCLDAHAARETIAPDAAADAAAEAEHECERICMRRSAAERRPPAVTCVFVPDQGCTFLETAATAILPPAPAIRAERTTARLEAFPATEYRSPELAPHGPPPKA